MKKIIILGVLFTLLSAFALNTTTNVYICQGKGSKRYHYFSGCRGLNSCSTTPKKVTLSYAQSIGRTLCGWED